MAEASLSHLNYGHPGIATYDLDKRDWTFSRRNTGKILRQVGIRKDDLNASTQVIPPSTNVEGDNGTTRRSDTLAHIKGLIRDYPEIAPGATLLADLALVSTFVLAVTATYDPYISNLFSIGIISTENSIVTRRIAATVTGECGNILNLMHFHKENQGWENDRTISLRGETLKDTESAFWNEEAAPIQQVCFAQSPERSSLLAVRLPTKTIIFRPVFSAHLSPSQQSSYFGFPTSHIQPRPILTIDINDYGGSAHADVAFNPDYQYQFALVDQSQTWSIWDIDHRKKSGAYTASCMILGPISEEPSPVGEDGWARVLWVGDVNTLVVCNRRHVGIISIAGTAFNRLPCPTLFLPRSTDWILDVKKHPTAKDCFFVLTSSKLFLMGVTTWADAQDIGGHKIGARVILAWPHYRGAEDVTLSMHAQALSTTERETADIGQPSMEDSAEEVVVLVQSRLNDLIHCYRFCGDRSGTAMTASSSSPELLELSVDGTGFVASLKIESMYYHKNDESDNSGPGHSYLQGGVSFYRLFVLRSDLSIHETILSASPSSWSKAEIEALKWSTVYHLSSNIRVADEYEMDDFVVPDDLEAEDELYMLQSQQDLEVLPSNRALHIADQTRLYDAILAEAPEEKFGITNIPAVTLRLQSLRLSGTDSTQAPIGTLLEYAGARLDVPDVDEASNALAEVFSSTDLDASLEIRHVASLRLLDLSGDEQSSLAHLYDVLLRHWVAPLPQDVPVRIRQAKERLARRISAELMLASARVRERHIKGPETVPDVQEGSQSLPILSSQPIESSQVGTFTQFSSQALTTPPLLVLQASSQPTSSQLVSRLPISVSPNAVTNPLERLGKHLRFRDDSVEEVPIKPNVNQLLAHWQLGSDPHAYNWEATEHVVYDDNLDEASQEQKEKERRRKARRERKQQRENELMRSQPSSQTFTISKPVPVPRSSPGPIFDPMASSSQVPVRTYSQVPLPGTFSGESGVADAFVAQSQVEPGRFGGRPDKKKKKKRVGGF